MLDWLRLHAPWLAPVLVFGLIVFVHELGHFLAAKAFGVYAPRFSIGFGPTLFSKRYGETEYVLAALPLGGYVRMASRDDETMAMIEGGGEQAPKAVGHPGELSEAVGEATGESPPKGWDPEAMLPFGPKPVPAHRWFESKSVPKRVAILTAGVVMNVILAFVVNVLISHHYGRADVPTRIVGGIDTTAAAAPLRAVLRPGDEIRAVQGHSVRTWGDVVTAMMDADADTLRLTTARGDVAVPVAAKQTEARARLVSALRFRQPAVIDSVLADRPGARGGLLPGDSIVAAGALPVADFDDVVKVIGSSAGREVPLDVIRRGAPVHLTVVPVAEDAVDPETGASAKVGRIGVVRRQEIIRRTLGAGEAVSDGARMTWTMGALVGTSLKNLATRRASLSELGGPIAIARTSVAAARNGALELFNLIALLSVNLAIFNLLPVPVLDGGQIVLTLAEAAKGSPFSVRARNAITIAGLVTVGLLFALVMFNDTIRRMV